MGTDSDSRGRERRKFHRAPGGLQVSWHKVDDEKESGQDIALDVSLGGLALRSKVEIPVGACIYVKIPNDQGGHIATIPSIVKWTVPHPEEDYYIIGVEFAHELEEEKEFILNLGPNYLHTLGGLQNREFIRVNRKIPIFYKKSFISGWRKGITIDLGMGGAKFLAQHPFARRAKVMLRLRIPGGEEIRAEAVVLGQNPTADGAQYKVNSTFIAMPEISKERLADYVVACLKPEKTADSAKKS